FPGVGQLLPTRATAAEEDDSLAVFVPSHRVEGAPGRLAYVRDAPGAFLAPVGALLEPSLVGTGGATQQQRGVAASVGHRGIGAGTGRVGACHASPAFRGPCVGRVLPSLARSRGAAEQPQLAATRIGHSSALSSGGWHAAAGAAVGPIGAGPDPR